MKKIILALLFVIFSSGTAFSEQLVIKLESGNEIIVNYKGSIQNVTLNGKGDSIKGISLPPGVAGTESQTSTGNQKITAAHQEPSQSVKKGEPEDKEKSWWLRLKWREPSEY